MNHSVNQPRVNLETLQEKSANLNHKITIRTAKIYTTYPKLTTDK